MKELEDTERFTKAEARILEHYAHIVRHGRFCTSLPTIAAARGCSTQDRISTWFQQ